ncbi:MAG: alpha/beta fold hydrolase [Candidatus Rokubacteria bacterium]|nr:alpha/beta fold hydrolase [Candidatus Rokubacteria bacterium]MBI3825086.1 alpha/beta fold hydrolase [Candidatus Rokubacteria bacterium]
MAYLVFIHGAGEDGRTWDEQVVGFKAQHRVLAVTLPGRHTREGEPALTSHADNARDVIAQMDAAGYRKPVVVVGHSMGGGVALMLALEHADRLTGLVLVCTGARMTMAPEFMDRARALAESGRGGQAVPLERLIPAKASPAVRAWLKARVMSASAETTLADFEANNGFDVMERLTEIKTPTLVVGGEADTMAPPKFAEFLAQKIEGAQLVVLPNCGHYPQVEQSAKFDEALEDFVDSLSG